MSGYPEPMPAKTVSNPHDPGADTAATAFDGSSDVAANPFPAENSGTIRIGTASWTDPTMTAAGVFYPHGADTAEERLPTTPAASRSSRWTRPTTRSPPARTAELWVERTPPDFTFDIKAHALMTGQPTETKRLPKDIREALPAEVAEKARIYAKDLPDELRDDVWAWFADGLEPLDEAGQLGSILLQYPRWFFTSSENRDPIEEAGERLRDAACAGAVEFRNAHLVQREEHRADAALPRRPPASRWSWSMARRASSRACRRSSPTTSPDLAVVRFHGRRAETWEAQDIPTVERFRYLYDEASSRSGCRASARRPARPSETHVLFNNCYANYGATNAVMLAELLQDLD